VSHAPLLGDRRGALALGDALASDAPLRPVDRRLGKLAGFIPSSAVFALGQVRAARLAPIPNARPKLAPKGFRVEHFAIDGAAGNAAQGRLGKNAASGPTTMPYRSLSKRAAQPPIGLSLT